MLRRRWLCSQEAGNGDDTRGVQRDQWGSAEEAEERSDVDAFCAAWVRISHGARRRGLFCPFAGRRHWASGGSPSRRERGEVHASDAVESRFVLLDAAPLTPCFGFITRTICIFFFALALCVAASGGTQREARKRKWTGSAGVSRHLDVGAVATSTLLGRGCENGKRRWHGTRRHRAPHERADGPTATVTLPRLPPLPVGRRALPQFPRVALSEASPSNRRRRFSLAMHFIRSVL